MAINRNPENPTDAPYEMPMVTHEITLFSEMYKDKADQEEVHDDLRILGMIDKEDFPEEYVASPLSKDNVISMITDLQDYQKQIDASNIPRFNGHELLHSKVDFRASYLANVIAQDLFHLELVDSCDSLQQNLEANNLATA